MTKETIIQVYKAIGHETRLNILKFLWINSQQCVCEIQKDLELEQSNISQHLRLLKTSGIITHTKVGNFMHYRINDQHEMYPIIKEAILHYVRSTS
ncbi:MULTISPECIES: helix-turn-helix transcriptional regulator [unclassified Fusibacter]|uniref:ArsR/SmtB family transcription factor n=1 Tax=unclassified Fusibacter TaxID=2624464 RepID=UPI0013E8F804|nr:MULTISPECIES: metalloregulator ArsR/SmtB family transcription factor [unclassified Fusibacter]MCK8059273.1 metalloregulator ArsR/SmtB family transcription factor [Fusibacter sp. A2]NPE21263.1 winged helix-turn-helix transcriptional regulator [Fusibacter sp. A1]